MASPPPPAPSAPLEMGECDCFLLAIDHEMQRRGQGIHLNQTVLELAQAPDLEQLQQSLQRLVIRHPALTYEAVLGLPGQRPRLAPSRRPASSIPLRIWDEDDEPGALDRLHEDLLNQSETRFHQHGATQLHCCLARLRNGEARLIFTWRHLAFDGFGAELLVCEAAALAESEDAGYVTLATAPQVRAKPRRTMLGHAKGAQPIARFFRDLLDRYQFRSVGTGKRRAGRGRMSVETLSEADSNQIGQLAASRCGLLTTPYFLACATKAHQRLWEARGHGPEAFLVSLPVQLRKTGVKGPLFQNNITFLFLCAEAAMSGDVPALCQAFQEQHGSFLRNRLGESFLHLQHLMSPMHPRLYAKFLKSRMRGEINSFYHSYTGELAPDLRGFAGAQVRNAFHIPMVFSPPGTGLFLSRRDGRFTVTMSWRDAVLSAEEAQLLKREFIAALLTG